MPAAPALPPFRAEFLGPRHWFTWFGIGLLRLLVLLPIPLQLAFGAGLGRLAGALLPGRRRVVDVNLRLCFPELDPAQREQRVREHFAALGRGIFEAALAWFASDARLARRLDVEGLEHLKTALASGRGTLLLTGHFTTLELGARLLAVAGGPFHAMYRPIDNPVIDWCMHRWRQARSGLPALPKDDLKRLVRALREGRAIWYAPDQALDQRGAVVVPFFGRPVLTISATSRLAEMGRAQVLPYFPEYSNGRWILRVQPPLENFPGPDPVADTARINALVEGGVRQAPAQYFWVHRRFKRWDESQPDVYAREA